MGTRPLPEPMLPISSIQLRSSAQNINLENGFENYASSKVMVTSARGQMTPYSDMDLGEHWFM